MKKIIRRDIRTLLGSRVMALMTFFVLQLALLPAVFMKKEAFVSTTLKCMVWAMVLLILYFVYEGANLYLKNLQQMKYFPGLREEGIPAEKVLWYKQVISLGTILALVALFIAGFVIDVLLIAGQYPAVKKELSTLDLSGLLGDTSGGIFLPTVLAVLNVILVLALTVALAYLSVSLSFVFFTRQKFAGISCMFVFMTFYLLFMMIDSRALGRLTSPLGRAAAVLVYLVMLLAMLLGHRQFILKKMTSYCYNNH